MSADSNPSSLPGQHQTVCVTGAGGFIASWLVKMLLERGYSVKGTMRNPDDPKNSHLWTFDGSKERLTLHQTDLLDYSSLKDVIMGCHGVFHAASPISDDPEKMVEPAVKGVRNVIIAASEAKVRRVIFTSSIGAIHMDPNRPSDAVLDETCWSNIDYCAQTKNWYCYAKVMAEITAAELAKEKKVSLAVVNPAVVLGPLLHSTLNVSFNHVHKYLTGSATTYVNAVQAYVHVKDVVAAHILVYETPGCSGRYFCAESVLHRGDLLRILSEMFPDYPLPTKSSGEKNPRVKPFKISNQELVDLGLKFTPVKQCLYETVLSLQDKGYLT